MSTGSKMFLGGRPLFLGASVEAASGGVIIIFADQLFGQLNHHCHVAPQSGLELNAQDRGSREVARWKRVGRC